MHEIDNRLEFKGMLAVLSEEKRFVLNLQMIAEIRSGNLSCGVVLN
jgi:hypothetical protein